MLFRSSRAEYRLLLRWDNADLRLADHGRRSGLLSGEVHEEFCRYRRRVARAVAEALPKDAESRYLPNGNPDHIETSPSSPPYQGGEIGEVSSPLDLNSIWDEKDVQRQVAVETAYWGYIKRESMEVTKFRKMESRRIPADTDYDGIKSLLTEARQKFKKVRPQSLGQAARIPGVTPSDIGVLMVHLERLRRSAQIPA